MLNRIYESYQSNENVGFSAVIGDQELGDRVKVDTGFRGVMEGTVTKLNFRFSRREITAEVTVE